MRKVNDRETLFLEITAEMCKPAIVIFYSRHTSPTTHTLNLKKIVLRRTNRFYGWKPKKSKYFDNLSRRNFQPKTFFNLAQPRVNFSTVYSYIYCRLISNLRCSWCPADMKIIRYIVWAESPFYCFPAADPFTQLVSQRPLFALY